MWQQHFNELFNSIPHTWAYYRLVGSAYTKGKAQVGPIVKNTNGNEIDLEQVKYKRPYLRCLGTKHMDMVARCKNTLRLHHIEWELN